MSDAAKALPFMQWRYWFENGGTVFGAFPQKN
jgi:hypothetical protein